MNSATKSFTGWNTKQRNDAKEAGERLRKKRIEMGYSIHQFATRLVCHYNTIATVERGEANLTQKMGIRWQHALSMDAADFNQMVGFDCVPEPKQTPPITLVRSQGDQAAQELQEIARRILVPVAQPITEQEAQPVTQPAPQRTASTPPTPPSQAMPSFDLNVFMGEYQSVQREVASLYDELRKTGGGTAEGLSGAQVISVAIAVMHSQREQIDFLQKAVSEATVNGDAVKTLVALRALIDEDLTKLGVQK